MGWLHSSFTIGPSVSAQPYVSSSRPAYRRKIIVEIGLDQSCANVAARALAITRVLFHMRPDEQGLDVVTEVKLDLIFRLEESHFHHRSNFGNLSPPLPFRLICLASPCRAGAIRSRPQAGGAGRANCASLEGLAPVRPHGDKQVTMLGTIITPVPVSCRSSIRCRRHHARCR